MKPTRKVTPAKPGLSEFIDRLHDKGHGKPCRHSYCGGSYVYKGHGRYTKDGKIRVEAKFECVWCKDVEFLTEDY